MWKILKYRTSTCHTFVRPIACSRYRVRRIRIETYSSEYSPSINKFTPSSTNNSSSATYLRKLLHSVFLKRYRLSWEKFPVPPNGYKRTNRSSGSATIRCGCDTFAENVTRRSCRTFRPVGRPNEYVFVSIIRRRRLSSKYVAFTSALKKNRKNPERTFCNL